MNWTSDAASMVAAAPPMIRGLIRRRLEKMARRQGVQTITAEFVSAASPHARRNTLAEPDTRSEQAFANIGGDPFIDAFTEDGEVHIFASGKHLDRMDARAAWMDVTQHEPATGRPRALYIHVPFCRARCSFCPFYVNRWKSEIGKTYAAALVREIASMEGSPATSAPFDAVYFGGGTPSDLAPEDLATVLAAIRRHMPLADDAEITLEGRVSGHGPDLTEAAIAGGINRFSLGVQSFDTGLRRSLGRIESKEKVLAFLNRLTDTGAVVVADLIYGLPGQTHELWNEDLRTLTTETRLSGADFYRLKVFPGSPIARRTASTSDKEFRRDCAARFIRGKQVMAGARWEQISVSHWRQGPCERSRYNTLAKSGADCIPIGCGAGGRLGGIRFFQEGDLDAYLASVRDGVKPIGSAIRLSGGFEAVDAIAKDMDRGILEPEQWKLTDNGAARRLALVFPQWVRAGLLEPARRGSWILTAAGQFQNVVMGARLSQLI